MTKYEMMDSLVENNGGYLLTSAVQEAGISRTYLMRYVRERDMERVEQGIYIYRRIHGRIRYLSFS